MGLRYTLSSRRFPSAFPHSRPHLPLPVLPPRSWATRPRPGSRLAASAGPGSTPPLGRPTRGEIEPGHCPTEARRSSPLLGGQARGAGVRPASPLCCVTVTSHRFLSAAQCHSRVQLFLVSDAADDSLWSSSTLGTGTSPHSYLLRVLGGSPGHSLFRKSGAHARPRLPVVPAGPLGVLWLSALASHHHARYTIP